MSKNVPAPKFQDKPYYSSNKRAYEVFKLIYMDTVTIDKPSMFKKIKTHFNHPR